MSDPSIMIPAKKIEPEDEPELAADETAVHDLEQPRGKSEEKFNPTFAKTAQWSFSDQKAAIKRAMEKELVTERRHLPQYAVRQAEKVDQTAEPVARETESAPAAPSTPEPAPAPAPASTPAPAPAPQAAPQRPATSQ